MKSLREIMDLLSPNDDEFRRSQVLKSKIIRNITYAFAKCGLPLATFEDDAIYYDTDERTATVKLDDPEVPLSALVKLMNSGLATDYIIGSSNHVLTIEFKVSEEIDHTV